jgi:hypothetical protein
LTDDGRRAVYVDRVAMLAIDAADECWVVMHQVVPDWLDLETLLLDESAVAACWAWEQTYLGMDISGTLYNELSLGALDGLEAAPRHTRTGRPGRGGFSHNEPSGGGRLVPQLRRPARMEGRRPDEERVRQETAGMIRRTRIRRTRLEIETSGQQIGAEVLAMIDPSLAMYPTPSPAHCPECAFVVPCLTMMEGGDPALDLATRFRVRPAETPHEGRLGAGGGGGRYLPIPPPTRR